MTRTINLYDGLEALYYFDSTYWDGGAGELSDMSGKGNHLTASGGVSVGASGPRGFEAAQFDGVDDSFSGPVDFPNHQTDFTVALIVEADRTPSNSMPIVSFGGGDETWFEYREAFKNWDWAYRNTDGDFQSGSASIGMPGTGTWDIITTGFERFSSTSGEFWTKSHVTGAYNTTERTGTTLQAGGPIDINQDAGYTGDIAMVGFWKRKLSWEEQKAVAALNAPRRALL